MLYIQQTFNLFHTYLKQGEKINKEDFVLRIKNTEAYQKFRLIVEGLRCSKVYKDEGGNVCWQ